MLQKGQNLMSRSCISVCCRPQHSGPCASASWRQQLLRFAALKLANGMILRGCVPVCWREGRVHAENAPLLHGYYLGSHASGLPVQ